jgi:tellurite resistance protein
MNSSVEAEIGLCLLLSAADGEISEDELYALTTRVGHLLGDDFPIDRLGGLVENELKSIEELGADGYVAELPRRIAPERRREALKAACKVACADGLSPEEEEMVREAAAVLEIDVTTIIPSVGYRDTVHVESRGVPGDDHDDEPNAQTRIVAERLVSSGWVDPMQTLHEAGIHLHGIGALALQYDTPTGITLRVEHHPCDGSLRLTVTDANDDGPDFFLYPDGREAELCNALVAMQDEIVLDGVEDRIAALSAYARVHVLRDGELASLA